MPPPVPRIEPVSTSGVNKEELILLIQDLQNELATMVRTYSGDKERLKSAIITHEDYQNSQMNKSSTLGTFFNFFFFLLFACFLLIFLFLGGAGSGIQQIASLKQTLNQALKQNAMLREKLQKIFREADTTDIPQVSTYFTNFQCCQFAKKFVEAKKFSFS